MLTCYEQITREKLREDSQKLFLATAINLQPQKLWSKTKKKSIFGAIEEQKHNNPKSSQP